MKKKLEITENIIVSNFFKKVTPSQSAFPVIVLCPPTYVDTKIANNIWMKEMTKKELAIDSSKFMAQWYNFYNFVAANALVYLLPAHSKLQDMVYVNSFVSLHEKNTIVLSNFTAEGRSGEEVIAGNFLKKLGYKVVKCPYKFEGWPELKFLGKANTYFGGYGIRTDKRALDWMEETFGIKIIKLKETDSYLYHLDCNVFVFNKDNIMMYTGGFTKKEIKEVEKVVNIHPVSVDAAYMGICNSLRIDNFLLNASSLEFMTVTDKYYKEEVKKNKELEKIAETVGLELIYIDLGEMWKSGALLSCCSAPLNYKDMDY